MDIEEYLSKSQNIALIIFLIDIRHSPTENDKLMYRYIIDTNSWNKWKRQCK